MESVLAHHVGSEVLDEDIRPCNQRLDQLQAPGLLEVDAEALLAAVGVKDEDVGAAFESLRSVTRWAPFVRQVRDPARPFHLDDLRSHIRQDTAAQRADDSVREVQDSNIIKNA